MTYDERRKHMKILAAGGGSGGHVTPVVAVLKELKAQLPADEPFEVVFICDKSFKTQTEGIMSALPFDVRVMSIPSGKLRRYANFTFWMYLRHFGVILRNIGDMFKVLAGYIAARRILRQFSPDVVFAKGGFVCLPVGIAASHAHVPLVLHDSDVRPGLTNSVLACFATAIATGMPLENYSYNPAISQYVGVPISPSIQRATPSLQREYREVFELPQDRHIIVAVGGGLGAVTINHAMLASAQSDDTPSGPLYVNVTGVAHFDAMQEKGRGLANYRPIAFVYENMEKLLGAADVVVTRASATVLQELAGLGKPTIAVPAQQLGDQKKNAAYYALKEAVIAVDDATLVSDLPGTIDALINNPERQAALSTALHSFARPQAAKDVADMLRKAAK